MAPRLRLVAGLLGVCVALSPVGCMTLAPQLPPTDFEQLEQVEDREEREQLYADQQIYKHDLPQGTRYTKGTDTSTTPRSWQSLDVVLRSDANAAAALPTRQLRRSRLFVALTVAAGILTVAGAAASAREGLNLGEIDPAGGVLLGGGLATVGFAITSGVFYGKSRQGYERAVDVYNDSLGMRLGLLDGEGNYVPPRGALVDEDGNVILDPGTAGPAPAPAAAPPPVVAPSPTLEPVPQPEADDPVAPESTDDPVAPESTDEAAPESTDEAAPEATPEATAAPSPEETGEATPSDPASAPVTVPEPGPATAALRLQPRL